MRSLVLVTGGAGYIGSVVADQLLARGRDVVVLDDLSTGHREAVPAGATFVQAGIGDRVAVTALFARYPVGAIVHMAAFALVAESVAEPEKYRANNVAAAKVLLDEAVAAGVRRLVFSSSCTVYGYPSAVPIAEDAPLGPVSPYGETKLEFERLLATYAVQHRLSSVSLRYFNAAGATEQRGEDHDPESHLIPNLLGVALGKRPAADVFGTDYPTPDGTAVRDYIHVDDLADAHVRALEAIAEIGKSAAYNLGTGHPHSVREVIDAVERVTGRKVPWTLAPRRPGDPAVLYAASHKAQSELRWTPHFGDLETIVRTAWAWHQAHPEGYDQK